MTNEEIQDIFFLECEEALGQAEEGLMACRDGSADAETVNGIFRAVHSIKGGAGAFSFTLLQAFTHKFETVLSYVRDGDLPLGEALNTLLLRAFDMLADHVAAVRGLGPEPDDAAVAKQLEEVAAAAAAGKMAEAEAAAGGGEAAAPEPAPAAAPADDLGLDFNLDDLMGDLAVGDDEAAAMEAAAAEVERALEEGDGPSDDATPPAAGPVAAATPQPAVPVAEAESPAGEAPAAPADGATAPEAGSEAPQGWRVTVRFRDGALANGSEPLLMLRELDEMGGFCLSVDAAALPRIDELDAEKAYMAWVYVVPGTVARGTIEDVFDFIRADCELTVEPLDAPVARRAPQVALPHYPAQTVPAAPAAAPAAATPAKPAAAPKPAAPRAEASVVPHPTVAEAPAAVGKGAPVAPATPAAPRAVHAVAQTVRVDLSKLDRLIDTVGELVIAQAMMAQRLAGYGLSAIDEMGMLDHLTREIQESTMSIRAQPIGSVFSRVPRIVRELESSTGKRVTLTMSGEGTELDKTVVERLGEPLTHLIRNAVDHGIESPEARLAAGKSAEGHLHLSAEQRSGRIIISIADDGAGINREAVLRKAVERGLVSPGAPLSNEEIDHLIFAPGFSTAEKVSNISGRGVGMDVVRQNVKDLGGRISIESRPGEGCVFTLALPLTLAIADGMIVTVGDQTVVIPLTHVLESLRPEEAEVKHIGQDLMVLNNRGKFLPVVRLDDAVGAHGSIKSAQEAVLIVVDTESHGQAVLMVDAIVDQRQFVIKSLEAHYQPISGVAGATILGDGKVALILDVDALVADNFAHQGAALAAA